MTHSRVLDRPRAVGWRVPAGRRHDVAYVPAAREDAFSRTLYERHAEVLLSFAVRLCDGDWHLAEDVVQETALRAWQNRAVLDPATNDVRTWLFTIARRIVIDHHRARQARPKEVGGSRFEEVAVPDSAELVVTLRAVLPSMTELSRQQCEVLLYSYYLGCSVRQTAAALSLAPGTVKSRAHYALRALRASLRRRAVID